MATQQSFNGDIRSVSPSREDYSSILETQVRHSWGFVVKKMEALTKDDRDLTEDEKLRLQGASDIMTVEQTDPEAIRTQKYLWQIIHIGPQVYMLHVTGVNPQRLSIMVEPVREHILRVMRKNITDDRLNHSNIRKLTAKYGLDRLHGKLFPSLFLGSRVLIQSLQKSAWRI